MRGNRLLQPTDTVDRHISETLGVRRQSDITDELSDAAKANRNRNPTIQSGGDEQGTAPVLNFGDGLSVAIDGETATIAVDYDPIQELIDAVDISPITRLSVEIELCTEPQASGRFELEDDDFTDDTVLQIQHVGMDEQDDEPEMDLIVCSPNPCSSGSCVVNWFALPGPVVGTRAFRYTLARAAS